MPDLECLTFQERQNIQELQNRVKNLMPPTLKDDPTLFYRFLKARDFNVDKAEKMLIMHLKWRKVYQVDTVLETFKPKEVFLKYIEPSVIGYDKEGNLVRYWAAGRLDASDIMKCVTLHGLTKHWIWFAQKNYSLCKQQIEKIGKMPSLCVILDLDKFSLFNATSKISVEICLNFVHLLQDNYPERLKHVYVINAPSYYVFIYTIVKSIMSSAMIKKIHIFGQNGWKEKLSECIDADVLPAFLGGKRTDLDGDPYCRSFVNIPGKISENYYLSEDERYFKDPAEVTSFLIRPSEKKEIFIHVKEVGSVIQWKFVVRNKTIGFGLFFQESQTILKEIIPIYEYNTSDGAEENSYKCLSKGKYVIIFDNSCSRFTTKEIDYIISVVKPGV